MTRARCSAARRLRPTLGHDLCQAADARYGETLGRSLNAPAVGIPAHPSSAGARAQADVVLRYLRRHPRSAPLDSRP